MARRAMPNGLVAFCDWHPAIKLTPVQRVVLRVTRDGVNPCDLEPNERELARLVFGEVDSIPDLARKVLCYVCGRRGGKTFAFEAIPLVHAMYTVPLYSIAPGQIPIALAIAPNDPLRQEIVNYAIGIIRSHPALVDTLVLPRGSENAPVVSSFMIRRPTGELVGFESGVATQGGYGGRGKSLVGVALDEFAFFRGETSKVNDVEIFNACIPGLLPGAKAIIASTPWAQSGLLWDIYSKNFGHPTGAIVAHAPTTMLRPDAEMQAMVASERERDQEYAEREFDAAFMAMGSSQFFPSALIEQALRRDITFPIEPHPGIYASAAADLGMRSDSSAYVGTARMASDPTVYLADILELRPKAGEPLRPSEVVSTFATRARALGCPSIMADRHYLDSLRENAYHIPIEAAPTTPSDAYVTLRQLLKDGRLAIPHPDTLAGEYRTTILRLLAQMREVQGRPLPGGGMSITLPRWRTGGHGDLVSALVLAGYQMGGHTPPRAEPEIGSAEWESDRIDAKRKELLANQRRDRRDPFARRRSQ